MRGLLQEKKIMFRYRGEGKFAVAKRRKQAEAIERNNAYQKQISTPAGIKEYITNSRFVATKNIGKKQYTKLKNKLNTMTRG
jgi:hypothetical protein|tara:strand:+ start:27 stop:272 length:246 start_codon:yes stop_codon:yes gene_type:complete